MKSIWKSSEIFLLISVEPHSKARRQHEKKKKKKRTGFRLSELPFAPEGQIKWNFDLKQKLNKGPKCTMIEAEAILGGI